MRVLITGGSGFIGTNLVAAYTASGWQVANFDILKPRNNSQTKTWVEGDINDAEKLTTVIREFNPTCVIHMAARTDLDGRTIEDYQANTTGVKNLISAVHGVSSIQSIIFASSRLVCKIGYSPDNEHDYCPTTAYGESKVEGEKIVRSSAHKLTCPWIILRPTSIWGPWFDVPYKNFFLAIYRGYYVHPGAGEIKKSFGFIGNTVHQIQHLANDGIAELSGKTIYLADYPDIIVSEMADTIQQALSTRRIKRVPLIILRIAAVAGDACKILGWHKAPITSFRLNNMITPMEHDLEDLKSAVGKLPFSMKEGVQITVDWLKDQGEIS